MIKVDLRSDTGGVTIECGTDSANAQEYWSFYLKYSVTSFNEVGRITTYAEFVLTFTRLI